MKLADCSLATTWVKVEGHGIVKQSPLPDYFMRFIDEYKGDLQEHNDSQTADPESFVTAGDLGETLYSSTCKPRPEILLSTKNYQTSLSDGNSVGNLYYSNYYDWQAKTLEQYINKCDPLFFKMQGKAGEFICLEARVNHLQEAMPFEEIEVNMYLEEIYSNGLKLYFEYYSLNDDTQKRKLAYGSNTIIWAKRADESSQPQATLLPENIYQQVSKQIATQGNN